MRLHNLYLHMKSGNVCVLRDLEEYTLRPEAGSSVSSISVRWAYPGAANPIIATIDLSQIEWITKEKGSWKFSVSSLLAPFSPSFWRR